MKVTEAIARYGKSQGDQVARHPRLLNRGEPTGRKTTKRLTRKPPRMEATIPTRRKLANTAKARLRKPRPGEQNKKTNVSRSPCLPKSEGRHQRWNGKLAYKRRSGTTGTTVPMTRHGENPCRVRISKKIAKLDSFN